MERVLVPLNKRNRVVLLSQRVPRTPAMENDLPPLNPISNPTTIYATQALPLTQPPHSWLKVGLQNQATFFTLDIEGQEVMIILQNPNFLAQLVTEAMTLAMDNYTNHVWLNNILSPLAPAIAPHIFHSMQQMWEMSTHFNPLLNPLTRPDLPFFSPREDMEVNPLIFPWTPQMTSPQQQQQEQAQGNMHQ